MVGAVDGVGGGGGDAAMGGADGPGGGDVVLEAAFRDGCCTKGAAWSPDGTCLLTATGDHVVRLFEVPDRISISGCWTPC